MTMHGGALVRAWFDMKSLSPDQIAKDVDEKRIKRSAGRLLHIVEEQVTQGVPRDRIVVGGFSQGAVVSLFGSFYSDHFSDLAGCIAMSGFFPPEAALLRETRARAENRKKTQKKVGPPVLMVHGTKDPVLAFKLGKKSYDEIKSWSIDVPLTFRSVKGMGHSMTPLALEHVMRFLKEVLPAQNLPEHEEL
mmetsp:Transcript_132990/g.256038  ORF Transcript_132990/g.256038 Transcript_132990/m.256038 type:complete len:191 (-) Transcript_132990:195-767(-)